MADDASHLFFLFVILMHIAMFLPGTGLWSGLGAVIGVIEIFLFLLFVPVQIGGAVMAVIRSVQALRLGARKSICLAMIAAAVGLLIAAAVFSWRFWAGAASV